MPSEMMVRATSHQAHPDQTPGRCRCTLPGGLSSERRGELGGQRNRSSHRLRWGCEIDAARRSLHWLQTGPARHANPRAHSSVRRVSSAKGGTLRAAPFLTAQEGRHPAGPQLMSGQVWPLQTTESYQAVKKQDAETCRDAVMP